MALVTNIDAKIRAVLQGSADLGTPEVQLVLDGSIEIGDGTDELEADIVYSKIGTIAASSSETLDLTDLTDDLGNAIVFAEIVAIGIYADPGNTNNVIVGASTVAAWTGPFGTTTHTLAIPPRGCVVLTAPNDGWAVTDGVADRLRLRNSGGSTDVTYSMIIVGRSA